MSGGFRQIAHGRNETGLGRAFAIMDQLRVGIVIGSGQMCEDELSSRRRFPELAISLKAPRRRGLT
jgi:hypothetical protein